ncbi:hypothetical protein FQA39_LY19285 [Lamprigera yunnana]|nr:hypothetical protein FQA39_LY19285 [Lamprigera yunnana]
MRRVSGNVLPKRLKTSDGRTGDNPGYLTFGDIDECLAIELIDRSALVLRQICMKLEQAIRQSSIIRSSVEYLLKQLDADEDHLEDVIQHCDVVIDFTTAEAYRNILKILQHAKANDYCVSLVYLSN